MVNKILAAFVVADVLFLISGAIELGFSIIVGNIMNESASDGETAARHLLYQRFPLQAGIVNAIFIFLTFLFTIPGIVMPTRGWLKLSGWLVAVSAIFSMVIGVYLWVLTLGTKRDFFAIWVAQDARVQDLMQTAFSCCGYFNSTSPAFVTDTMCTSPAAAALMRGCAAPISSFSNVFIDDIFTAVFGMVGMFFCPSFPNSRIFEFPWMGKGSVNGVC
jgi:hypothetical protein